MSLRSYSDALDHLNAVQSIEAAKDAWLAAGKPSKQYVITETVENLRRMGYSVCLVQLRLLSFLSLMLSFTARKSQFTQCYTCCGNEGKGLNQRVYGFHSSSRQVRLENWCVKCIQNGHSFSLITPTLSGLYTSPHLISVRERIRINGTPISEEDFAKFFFEVWERLDENDKVILLVQHQNP